MNQQIRPVRRDLNISCGLPKQLVQALLIQSTETKLEDFKQVASRLKMLHSRSQTVLQEHRELELKP